MELRFSFDHGHLPEPLHVVLCLLVLHPFYHQTGLALLEAVSRRPLADYPASVLGHPCLDPILARLFDFLNICPLFLWLYNRDWKSRNLLRIHVDLIDGEVTVIFFARLGLSLVLNHVRDRLGGGRLGLLGNSVQQKLELKGNRRHLLT